MLHALAVGINDYRDLDIRNLSFARRDAEDFARLLDQHIAPDERCIRVLVDDQATRRNVMVAAGDELPRVVRKDDVVVIYFAGHGSPETSSSPDRVSRYLIMHDTEFERVYATGIDMDEVGRWFDRLTPARLSLLILDCCFSGRAGGRSFLGPKIALDRIAFRGATSLKAMDLGRGRIVLCAAGDDELALEDAHCGHGIFTHYLLRALMKRPEDGATKTVSALYDEVAESVRLATGGRQSPVLGGRIQGARVPLFDLALPP